MSRSGWREEGTPRIEDFMVAVSNGRPLLQIEDAPSDNPVSARLAADSTLKMLAYPALLHDPEAPPFRRSGDATVEANA